MYYYPDELYHHGIKGMRWGVRNGPPYPLSPQTHASVVRSGGRGRTRPVSRGRVRGLTEEEEARRARRNKILKGVGVGLGAAALAGGAGYLAYRNRDKLGSMARNAKQSISDRAYVEREIAKTRFANAKKAISDRAYIESEIAKTRLANAKSGMSNAYNKALGKLPDNVQVAYGKAYYNAGETAKRAKSALATARGTVANRAGNIREGIINTARRASTKAGVRANQIFRGSKSMEAANRAREASRRANALYGRMDTMRSSGREGALASLSRQATRASTSARRYNDLARGYARRRQLALGLGAGGVAALGGGTAAGISAYRKKKARKRRR